MSGVIIVLFFYKVILQLYLMSVTPIMETVICGKQ